MKQNESTNCNKTIGFEDFKKGKKRSVRPDFSLGGRKLKAVSTKSKAKEIEVSINIDFFKMEASGNQKRCLGKTLPVKVRPKRSRQDFVPELLQNMAASEELQGDNPGAQALCVFPVYFRFALHFRFLFLFAFCFFVCVLLFCLRFAFLFAFNFFNLLFLFFVCDYFFFNLRFLFFVCVFFFLICVSFLCLLFLFCLCLTLLGHRTFPLQSITFLLVLSFLLLFGQMITGNLISLNIRGISNFRKRKTIFTWCRKQKADIIFLQETHSTEKNEAQWKREWSAPFFCSHGPTTLVGLRF